MRDQISIERLQGLHPKFRNSVLLFINEIESTLNLTIRISQGMRTFAEQGVIYAEGRTEPGKIVTYSLPGSTYHNYGLAVDLVVLDIKNQVDWNFDYKKLKAIYPKYGMTWGGMWAEPRTDEDHYENNFGLNWRVLLHRYNAKEFITGTNFVVI